MAISTILLFTIIMVSMSGINSQLQIEVPDQSGGVQTRMEETLIQVVKTLNESMVNQHRIEDTLDLMASVLSQSVDTQNNMKDTLDQIANTQTQIANVLAQVVNLLQMQNEQLQTRMATTTSMDEQISTQNPIISLQPDDILDCSDIASRGPLTSGSYTIPSSDNLGSFPVYCDMDTDGGGWTVIQRRFDGTVDFYRGWDAYADGFGTTDGEYWLGLKQIHHLTRRGVWTLRIDLVDFQNNTAFAEYRSFSVGDAADHYRLSIGTYSGTAGDIIAWHDNFEFSTKDSDHDAAYHRHCAQLMQGAWWYRDCGHSNLNGLYLGASQDSYTGMIWWSWKSSNEVLKGSEMKIRRTQ